MSIVAGAAHELGGTLALGPGPRLGPAVSTSASVAAQQWLSSLHESASRLDGGVMAGTGVPAGVLPGGASRAAGVGGLSATIAPGFRSPELMRGTGIDMRQVAAVADGAVAAAAGGGAGAGAGPSGGVPLGATIVLRKPLDFVRDAAAGSTERPGGGGGGGGDGAATGAAPGTGPGTSRRTPLYKHAVFVHFAVLVGVYVLCLCLVAAIRPPFTYVKPKVYPVDDPKATTQAAQAAEAPRFSGSRAALVALAPTLLAAAGMIAYAVWSRSRGRRLAPTKPSPAA
jgi:hypothetical protein